MTIWILFGCLLVCWRQKSKNRISAWRYRISLARRFRFQPTQLTYYPIQHTRIEYTHERRGEPYTHSVVSPYVYMFVASVDAVASLFLSFGQSRDTFNSSTPRIQSLHRHIFTLHPLAQSLQHYNTYLLAHAFL